MIHIRNISKKYRKNQALNEVSVSFEPGTVYGLVGKNGAGKSTLIDSILGLVTLDKGTIDTKYVTPDNISYMTSEKVYSDKTKLKSIIEYTKLISLNFNDSLMLDLIRPYNIDLSKRIEELSRGEAVAFSFCLALARDTEVIIMDEPFSGIDIITRELMISTLFTEVDVSNKCLIISSHELSFIEKHVDQVFLMKDGKLYSYKEMSNNDGLSIEEWFTNEHE